MNTSRKLFKRNKHIQNTFELFKVVQVNESFISVTYNISELDKEIEAIFYHNYLLLTLDSSNHRIIILKTRKKKN